MSLKVNLRHLETKEVVLLGEIPADNLELGVQDELVHLTQPLKYDLTVEEMEEALLVQGSLSLEVHCECARCLKPFVTEVVLEDWSCHIPLEGEDKATVVDDCVDLTPYVREDILLTLPQRPLCKPECQGLPNATLKQPGGSSQTTHTAESAWAALDQLKFEKE